MTVENCLLILEWHSIKIVDKIIGTRTWLFYGVDARVMTFAVRRVLCAKPGGLNLLLRVFRTTAKSCQMMWNLGSSTWSSCCLIFVNTCNEKKSLYSIFDVPNGMDVGIFLQFIKKNCIQDLHSCLGLASWIQDPLFLHTKLFKNKIENFQSYRAEQYWQ